MKKKLKNLIFILSAVLIVAVILYFNHMLGWFILSKPSFNETYVTLRFDDGWISQYTAYKLLKTYNLTGSIYIITSKIGEEGYLNESQLKKISEVMEIGAHTRTHADLQTSSLEGTLKDEIGGCYQDLVKLGFEPKTFVYPYGNYNKDVIKVVKKYFYCASTQDVGVNTKDADLYLLKDFTFRAINSIDDLKRVIKPNTWTTLTFHNVGEAPKWAPKAVKDNTVSLEFFEQILNYLKDQNIKVITLYEGCKMLEQNEK